jgi:hypothetical protein
MHRAAAGEQKHLLRARLGQARHHIVGDANACALFSRHIQYARKVLRSVFAAIAGSV